MLETIVQFFDRYGYVVIFFGVMLENAGIPVPGETILLAAGFWAYRGGFSLPVVMTVAATGAILGDNLGFALGRRFGIDLVRRYGRYLFITDRRLAKVHRYFERHGNKTVFFARFISGLRVLCALVAGLVRMRWPTFLFYNATGALVWSVVIALIGYFFGHSWDALETWMGRTSLIILIIVVGGAVAIAAARRATAAPCTDSAAGSDRP